MKTARFLIVSLLFLLLAGLTIKDKLDEQSEKKAIMALMEEETAAYYASDYDRWTSTYVNDSTGCYLSSGRGGYGYSRGQSGLESMKPYIVAKKPFTKETKTPMQIRIYDNTAWVLFTNSPLNEKGEPVNQSMVTCFVEKQNGKWKIAYRNVLDENSYMQPDQFALMNISYAKSMGKNPEDAGKYMGDMFKQGWTTEGFPQFAQVMYNNWNSSVRPENARILEQDDNHMVFTIDKFVPDLKQRDFFNVSYDEYLSCLNSACQTIAESKGIVYKQENTSTGVKVTMNKK